MEKYPHPDLTYQIIGCAMEVHKFLGNGFQEVIYQRALAYEFDVAGLEYRREVSMEIYYKDLDNPIGRRRVDFLVEQKILVETKAITGLTATDYNQILNYLATYNLEIALLINFGDKSLQFKRFILTDHPYKRKDRK